MKKRKSLYISMSRSEKILGWLYLAFQQLALGELLHILNRQLAVPMAPGTLNFVYYLVSFLAVALIFRRFLGSSLVSARQDIWNFIQAVVLGTVAYWACANLLSWALGWLLPDFQNINDASIANLAQSNFYLTAIGVVLLVPPVEEVFFRGLIFRNLWQKSKVAAYLVSMAAFAAIHIIGYLGMESVTITELVLCFIQYLPAGLCLAWTYTKADNILAPILVHAIFNAIGIGLMR